jgi:maleate isomerase
MNAERTFRIGQIAPSSNVTMERQIPAMLHSRELVEPERLTFHFNRMRVQRVTKDEPESMNRNSDQCAAELGSMYSGMPALLRSCARGVDTIVLPKRE